MDGVESCEESACESTTSESELRGELAAAVPLGELQTIRETVGCKRFDSALRGNARNTQKKLGRANKNRPSEQSSKKRVSSIREVVPAKKRVRRDPRFDDLSGHYNEDLFKKSYDFLNDYRQTEKKEVQKALKKTTDSSRRSDLQFLLNEMQQREARATKAAAERKAKKELKKQQLELVKKGKKPFYLKNSEKRKLELAQKFQELKKKGQLEKFLEKKRKRNASRDRRRMPHGRKELET